MRNAGTLGIAWHLWDEYAADSSLKAAPQGARPGSVLNNPMAGLDRHELEARLLCCQPRAEIAKRLAVSEAVIDAYEAVFFNVADRLDSVSWVLHRVIGPRLHRGATDNDVGVFWKLYGYAWRCPAFLDQLVSTVKITMISAPEDVHTRVREDGEWSMHRRAAQAARSLPVDEKTRTRLLEIQAEVEAAKGLSHDDSGLAGYQANLQIALSNISWTVGGKPMLRVGASGEPRAGELLLVSAGRAPVTVDGNDFTWPEPERPQGAAS
jgi:hypothetical protein